uniref:Retrovirus-related Pol polyprotein from transposon TNT 1-94 n=1 Tax=Tanacetum cinerariifolium TaxID=118510 RepID=A0A699H3B6_TANCI|nr:retrovirus-related Pol polyprotein from transposon TNT 1-94 [Tanacetum cinerariifolium]
MALVDDKSGLVRKESARNGEWVKISMRKVHTLLEMEDNDERKSFIDCLCIDLNYVEEQRNNLVIFPSKSQVKVTDSLVNVTDSSVTDYDSADESSICSTHLPSLKKLVGVEPVSGPKTIKSILKSNSTFKDENLKGVTINEPTSAPAKGNKNVSSSKNNSAPAAPQDRWYKEKHIELVNIMGNSGTGMLIREMAKELSAALAHECLFVDFLPEEEPKKVSEALKHLRWVDVMQEELN